MTSLRLIDVHDGITVEYFEPTLTNLLDRWAPHQEWLAAQSRAGLDPFSKVTTERNAAYAPWAGQRHAANPCFWSASDLRRNGGQSR